MLGAGRGRADWLGGGTAPRINQSLMRPSFSSSSWSAPPLPPAHPQRPSPSAVGSGGRVVCEMRGPDPVGGCLSWEGGGHSEQQAGHSSSCSSAHLPLLFLLVGPVCGRGLLRCRLGLGLFRLLVLLCHHRVGVGVVRLWRRQQRRRAALPGAVVLFGGAVAAGLGRLARQLLALQLPQPSLHLWTHRAGQGGVSWLGGRVQRGRGPEGGVGWRCGNVGGPCCRGLRARAPPRHAAPPTPISPAFKARVPTE